MILQGWVTLARVRILVTGGAGYIGSQTCQEFLDAGHEVVVLDDLRSRHASLEFNLRPFLLVHGSHER